MSKVLILGITSAIAKEFARQNLDSELIILGRNENRTNDIRKDLENKGAKSVQSIAFDFCDFESMKRYVSSIEDSSIDQVLICFGTLTDQERAESDPDYALKEYQINFTSQMYFSNLIEQKIKESGTLAVVTSVAGDRGRKSNYYYGSAKGGMSLFLEGLRAKLSAKNINVLDIRPGFVDTPMTKDVPKNFLFAKPSKVASDISKAIISNKAILYTPFFWRWIMLLIRNIPRFIFHKMNI